MGELQRVIESAAERKAPHAWSEPLTYANVYRVRVVPRAGGGHWRRSREAVGNASFSMGGF